MDDGGGDDAPTFSRVPEGDETTGQDCVDLAVAYGVPLDAWQIDIVRGHACGSPAAAGRRRRPVWWWPPDRARGRSSSRWSCSGCSSSASRSCTRRMR